jgi:PEGA domain
MIRLALVGGLCLPVMALSAADERTCGTGRVTDVQAITTQSPGTVNSTTEEKTSKDGKKRTWDTTSTETQNTDTTYLVTVQVNGMTYTGRGGGDVPWGFKPTSFVIGDSVPVCVEKNKIYLQRPDGKQFKATIVQASRSAPDPSEVDTAASSGAPATSVPQAPAPAAATTATAAAVKIVSEPTGADIEVDGAYLGSTPSTLQLTAGDHNIVVRKQGFQDWKRSLKIVGGDVTVNAQLTR